MSHIATGWTEPRAVKNKAQRWVLAALLEITAAFPFPIKGIDSDNGAEFINAHLLRYCNDNQITFTPVPAREQERRRARRAEELVGDPSGGGLPPLRQGRRTRAAQPDLRTRPAADQLLLPAAEAYFKTRIGAKVTKKYDTAQTPYQRVMASPHISKKIKTGLTSQYRQLNPAQIRRDILAFNDELLDLVKAKHQPTQSPVTPPPPPRVSSREATTRRSRAS